MKNQMLDAQNAVNEGKAANRHLFNITKVGVMVAAGLSIISTFGLTPAGICIALVAAMLLAIAANSVDRFLSHGNPPLHVRVIGWTFTLLACALAIAIAYKIIHQTLA